MPVIGFHASHEQISPAQLLLDVQHAESAGFQAAMCSDHFEPWSPSQGHAGYAWSWLGAALATTGLRFGVVTAPGQRYHPAITAQASATLSAMFPERFWAALGSGQNMNERITGDPWPEKAVRQQRLEECVDIIRRLHAGEEVTHRGLVTVERARLWDLPEVPPALIAPVMSVGTARRAATWADGLITTNQDPGTLLELLGAYRDEGGRGKAVLQVHLSWAESDGDADEMAYGQWRTNAVGPPLTWEVATAQDFVELAERKEISREQVRQAVNVSSDPAQHAQWLHEYGELGFDELYLHHVGQDQGAFIDTFGSKVLPELRS
ncbi:TIGR03885 family FMN-dependent LLM class oxidoreductase [Arthrobacter sp. H41]|uniref:TIGR03885 family FMN-dependent LLM class oxidoreductase n=1 Tax=Arthrobacter sp. H41 TaxID=1312978 RepID=UPI00047A46BD|nr:TIGR03885 family FMN-dependent LLM class oxidoreductase [Arthrobacter sp. H41]